MDSLGPKCQALASLWLWAEAALAKSGCTDLSFNEIRQSSIPQEWKDWMSAKLMVTDTTRPSELFGKVFTEYIQGLPASITTIGGSVMSEAWCCSGKTGIIGLVLCLYWQAEYSGAGKDWERNIERVEGIFNTLIATPEL